jgi:hypothetical protein
MGSHSLNSYPAILSAIADTPGDKILSRPGNQSTGVPPQIIEVQSGACLLEDNIMWFKNVCKHA